MEKQDFSCYLKIFCPSGFPAISLARSTDYWRVRPDKEILSRFPMGLAHPVSRQQCKILNAKENISGKNGSPVPDRNAGIAPCPCSKIIAWARAAMPNTTSAAYPTDRRRIFPFH